MRAYEDMWPGRLLILGSGLGALQKNDYLCSIIYHATATPACRTTTKTDEKNI